MTLNYENKRQTWNFSRMVALGLIGLVLLGLPAQATTNFWLGAGDGFSWSDEANWTAGIPGLEEDVAVDNAGANILLDEPTPRLASFTLTGGTLVFTNWSTCLQADVVTIDNGVMTLPPAFTDEEMSNRVWIVCDDFQLETAGKIEATGRGYAGGSAEHKAGWGIGGGENEGNNGTGAGHGGEGGGENGKVIGGMIYGSLEEPMAPGSGGGCGGGQAGHGGGIVYIEASQSVLINGTITADGTQGGSKSGSGSGGSILITCETFGGNGRLSTNGGDGRDLGGPGAGGRIAVHYNVQAQSVPPRVKFATRAGALASRTMLAEDGTVSVSGIDVLSETIDNNRFDGVRLFIGQTNRWQTASLTVSNSTFTIANPGFELEINNDIVIGLQGTLGIGDLYVTSNYWLQCGGDLIVQDGGVLELYGVITNIPSGSPDAQLEVTGAVNVEDGGRITITSDRWLGGTPLLRIYEITVAPNAVISADNLGFGGADRWQKDGYGPGAGLGGGLQSGGGGYGGQGGDCSTSGDQRGYPYGLANAPRVPGSGGGYGTAGGARGGGLIHLEVERDFVLQGTLSARGKNGTSKNGGGSGGGIFIKCRRFKYDTQAVLCVDGGTGGGNSGGGGGGRIAIWEGLMGLDPALLEKLALAEPTPTFLEVNTNLNALALSVSVSGAAGSTQAGSDGTFAYIRVYYASTMIIVR